MLVSIIHRSIVSSTLCFWFTKWSNACDITIFFLLYGNFTFKLTDYTFNAFFLFSLSYISTSLYLCLKSSYILTWFCSNCYFDSSTSLTIDGSFRDSNQIIYFFCVLFFFWHMLQLFLPSSNDWISYLSLLLRCLPLTAIE